VEFFKLNKMKKASLILIVLSLLVLCSFVDNFTQLNQSRLNDIKIGSQVWMTENLNVDKFRNGHAIPHARTDEEWRRAREKGQPAWCYFENDLSNGERYGKLYNWFAVNDPRGLAPKGWHIPSYDEWKKLYELLGGINNRLGMKSTSGWYNKTNDEDNHYQNNSSGFSGLPGGYRIHYGQFSVPGQFAFWWSSEGSQDFAYCFKLASNDYGRIENYDKGDGLSVRCIKD
jgi:uncharacterized protein (TIGR02145 family)